MNTEVLLVIQKLLWPLGITVIAFFLVRLIKTLDRVDKAVTQLEKTVTKQEAETKLFRVACEKHQRTTTCRLNAHTTELNLHDRDIAILKERNKHEG